MEIINYTATNSFTVGKKPHSFIAPFIRDKKIKKRASLVSAKTSKGKSAERKKPFFSTSRAQSKTYSLSTPFIFDEPAAGQSLSNLVATKKASYNKANKATFRKARSAVRQRVFLRHLASYFAINDGGSVKKALKAALILSLLTTFIISIFYSNKKWGWVAALENPFTLASAPLLATPTLESEEATLQRVMAAFAIEQDTLHDDEGYLQNAKGGATAEKPFCEAVTITTYTVKSGDTIESITRSAGLQNISTIIAVNDIDNVRLLRAGQKLRIPNIDGLFYTSEEEETLSVVAQKFGVRLESLADVNDKAQDFVAAGERLFIPGAKLSKSALQDALGQTFISPLSYYRLTSHFGPRIDPISGVRSNHTGIDMAAPMGTKIKSAGTGTVSYAGTSPVFGNYVIINHSGGIQTLYGHMSKILAKKGQWVAQGSIIGLVGSTGYSTGPHLHFTVYKNGKLSDPFSLIEKR